MIALTKEIQEAINNSLANRKPCVLATASPTGDLSISFRGSMMAWDDKTLAYWDRSLGTAMEHVLAHGKVVVLFRDPEARVGWKFFGTAIAYPDGPVRDQVMLRVPQPELDRDPERKGYAVIVTLDRVENLQGHSLMERTD